jgi:hypothetical protein
LNSVKKHFEKICPLRTFCPLKKKVEKSKVPLFVRLDCFSEQQLLSGGFVYKDHFAGRILRNSQN